MKGFYDLWAIATTFDFQGAVLAEAIRATFERRQTKLPLETPEALALEFAENPTKQAQWQGFLRRTALPTSSNSALTRPPPSAARRTA